MNWKIFWTIRSCFRNIGLDTIGCNLKNATPSSFIDERSKDGRAIVFMLWKLMRSGILTKFFSKMKRCNFLIIFMKRKRPLIKGLPTDLFPRFSTQDISFLRRAVTNDEIKKALFDIAHLKVLGSDGFHALFFQSQWDIVGSAVCEWVKGIFARNSIDVELNNTLIVLIPSLTILKILVSFGLSVSARYCISWLWKLLLTGLD